LHRGAQDRVKSLDSPVVYMSQELHKNGWGVIHPLWISMPTNSDVTVLRTAAQFLLILLDW